MLKPNEHALFEHGTCIFRTEQSVSEGRDPPRIPAGAPLQLWRAGARAGACWCDASLRVEN